MITVDEVADLIRREARRQLRDDTPIEGSTRLKDLGLSSLQISEIVFTLEERYEVEFDDARAAEVETLYDVVSVANEALIRAGVPLDDQPPLKTEGASSAREGFMNP